MAITNYTTLQTAIGDFLNRDDLTSVIPTFVQLAEAQMNRDIRHWKMEKRATASTSAEYTVIPGDWMETIQIHVIGGGTYPLDLASRQTIADKRSGSNDQSGRPRYYCHADSQIELYPTPDATYDIELLYVAKIPDLATNSTNWLLEEAPDAYLYSSLLHSAPYLQEDARVAVWAQMYSAVATQLNTSSDKARMSGSGLTLKVRGLG